ncbi:MAG: hypothetical protein JNL74_00960 [Fibrobacteres bacterium]|nr:hypothetical protein [Fibrobacterota bacterium]
MENKFCALTVKLSPFVEMNFHKDNLPIRINGVGHPYSIHLPFSRQTDTACKALSANTEVSIIDYDGTAHRCHIASVSQESNGLVLLTEP